MSATEKGGEILHNSRLDKTETSWS